MLIKKPIMHVVHRPGKSNRNVYISICEPESQAIDIFAKDLTNEGYIVHHNWDLDITPRDDISPEMMRNATIQNIKDIIKTDIFIIMILTNTYNYPEAFAELGIALMNKKPAIIVDLKKNPHITSNPYYHASGVFKVGGMYDLYDLLDTLYENF